MEQPTVPLPSVQPPPAVPPTIPEPMMQQMKMAQQMEKMTPEQKRAMAKKMGVTDEMINDAQLLLRNLKRALEDPTWRQNLAEVVTMFVRNLKLNPRQQALFSQVSSKFGRLIEQTKVAKATDPQEQAKLQMKFMFELMPVIMPWGFAFDIAQTEQRLFATEQEKEAFFDALGRLILNAIQTALPQKEPMVVPPEMPQEM